MNLALSHSTRIVALLCLAEVLCMTGFAAYPAILPMLSKEWHLNGGEAGLISGAFFFGYMLTVPFLSSLTDRIDARMVFAASCFLASVGTAGFALTADGVTSGMLCQAVAGAGLAGTYMPGLKALTDRVTGQRQARFIAFYTATFGIGTSLSLLVTGWLVMVLPWRVAFDILALGPILAAAIILIGLRAQEPHAAHHATWLPRIIPVLRMKETRRYILGYTVHCWELFGLRSWMVAFIVFAYGLSQESSPPISATEAAALINLVGLPSSILGNEVAGRIGRIRWIAFIMSIASVLCWIVGISSTWPWWLMLIVLAVYFMTVMADSAALTTGLIQATPVAERGAAMGVYSLSGFGAGCLAPLIFGVTLDRMQSLGSSLAWTLALGTLGIGGLIWSVSQRHAKGP